MTTLKKTIGIGAIGVGGRMRFLLKDMLERHGKTVELRAMADEAAAALDETGKVLKTEAARYADYRKLIRRDDIDWVLIGSKNYLHKDHCVAAFRAGKHVFCEKPMAITIPQCEAIRKAHLASGRLFATGFVLRHAPMYCTIHKLLREGRLGRIVSLEANELLRPDHGAYIMRNWRRFRKFAGSHLLEKCAHDIDLINWMIGDVPSRVASFGGLNIFTPANRPTMAKLKQPGDNPPLFLSWPVWENIDPFTSRKDIEDNRVCILEYRNQARVVFHTNCCAAYSQRRMMICGLEGTLEADLATGLITLQRIGRNTQKEIIDTKARGGHGGADGTIMDDLVECMTTRKAPKASGEEAFQSAVACLALDEAFLKGKVVNLEPLWKKFGV